MPAVIILSAIHFKIHQASWMLTARTAIAHWSILHCNKWTCTPAETSTSHQQHQPASSSDGQVLSSSSGRPARGLSFGLSWCLPSGAGAGSSLQVRLPAWVRKGTRPQRLLAGAG